MGCAAALYAALEDPAHISGLVLANPPTCYELRDKFKPMYPAVVITVRSDQLAISFRLGFHSVSWPMTFSYED